MSSEPLGQGPKWSTDLSCVSSPKKPHEHFTVLLMCFPHPAPAELLHSMARHQPAHGQRQKLPQLVGQKQCNSCLVLSQRDVPAPVLGEPGPCPCSQLRVWGWSHSTSHLVFHLQVPIPPVFGPGLQVAQDTASVTHDDSGVSLFFSPPTGCPELLGLPAALWSHLLPNSSI